MILLIPCFTVTATAASATKTLAYVTSYDQNSVSIIDTATNSVLQTIPVGNKPIGVAVSPDGKEAYVVNSDSNSVSIIDTYTGEKKGDIGVGQQPQRVAFAPDGKYAYVTSMQGGTVSVIDTATRGVTYIMNNSLKNGQYIVISPDGSRAYVSTHISGNVMVVSLPDKTVIGKVSYMGVNGNVPGGIALNADGSRAYVVLAAHTTVPGDVSVIDTANIKELNNFSTGADKEKWGIKYYQNQLYIANTQNNQVIVSNIPSPNIPLIIRKGFATAIATAKPSPTPMPPSAVAEIATGTDPWDLDFTLDYSTLYVSCRDSVTVIDVASRTAATSIMLQGMHYGVDVATVSVFVPDPSPSPSAPAQATDTPTVTVSAPPSVTPTATDNTIAPTGNETNATQASSLPITPTPAPVNTDITLYLAIGGLALVVVVLLLAVVALGGYVLGKK